MSRTVCAILGILGFVALLVIQFNLPWAHQESSGFGATAERTATTWGQDSKGSAFGFSGSDSKGWYDSDWDDDEQGAVGQLRVGAPILVAAVVLLLVGAILSFAMGGAAGPVVTVVGGLLAAGGTVLFMVALQDLYDNDQAWQVAFYLAITGAVLGIAGGVIGLAGRRA